MPQIGVVLRPQTPPEGVRAVVEHADRAGIAQLWLWEDCFLEGGLTTAAAALAWSERLVVGVGLLPVPLRNPALVAMEVATLARLFPGRLVVTLGHGVQPWMAQVGARADSPMTLLREHITAVRDLLAGQRVDVDGRYVHLEDVSLDWPPSTPPTLLVGARGDKTVALAGELGDGVLLDAVADPDAVRRARALVDRSRPAEREGHGQVVVYTEVDPREHANQPSLDARVRDVIDSLATAGADTVVLQATEDAPDPSPLIDAVARIRA